jgi:hypothetical protein
MGSKQSSESKEESSSSNEQYIKWFYQSNVNEKSEWCLYSDIESAIIEISNDKRSVRRVINKHKQQMRKHRFEASSTIPFYLMI